VLKKTCWQRFGQFLDNFLDDFFNDFLNLDFLYENLTFSYDQH